MTETSRRWRHTSGWTLGPYADLSHAFVFQEDPVRVLVIDKVAMYVLQVAASSVREQAVDKLAAAGFRDPEHRLDTEITALIGLGLLDEVTA